jgi:hypothetical protein
LSKDGTAMINPVPKPKLRKQKRAVNNSRPTADDICEVCGKPYAALHEIFFGRGKRQLSIKYRLQKRLCYEHHNMPGGMNPHFNKAIDDEYKREGQRKYEETHSREDFLRLFGRNYLDTV